jgi:hypothetical protein
MMQAGPDELAAVAADIRAALAAARADFASWRDNTMKLARALLRGREMHKDDAAFGAWLKAEDFGVNDDDRAALISMAQHSEIAERVLADTARQSWRNIWRKEIAPEIPPEVLEGYRTPAKPPETPEPDKGKGTKGGRPRKPRAPMKPHGRPKGSGKKPQSDNAANAVMNALIGKCADSKWRALAQLASRVQFAESAVEADLTRLGDRVKTREGVGGVTEYQIEDARPYQSAQSDSSEIEDDTLNAETGRMIADEAASYAQRLKAENESLTGRLERITEDRDAIRAQWSAKADNDAQRYEEGVARLKAEIAALKAKHAEEIAALEAVKRADDAVCLAKTERDDALERERAALRLADEGDHWRKLIMGAENERTLRENIRIVGASALVAGYLWASTRGASVVSAWHAHALKEVEALMKDVATDAGKHLVAQLAKRLGIDDKPKPPPAPQPIKNRARRQEGSAALKAKLKAAAMGAAQAPGVALPKSRPNSRLRSAASGRQRPRSQ